MYGRDRRQIGAWPTNDGLVMTYVAAPADEFPRSRADPEGCVLDALDQAADLGERADRMFGTADLQNRFHKPYGPGWALVGDAVTSRPIRSVAGAEIAVVEVQLDSPPEQPLRCPPGLTRVHFHDGQATRRIVSYHAQIPAICGIARHS